MNEPQRLDFLVYYKKQLETIIGKLEKQIEIARKNLDGNIEPDTEVTKDLTNPEFIRTFLATPDLMNALNECRDMLRAISDEETQENEKLYYHSKKHGKKFAMLAISQGRINLYFAPRLGLYENLPESVRLDVRFGKSLGDRWDKFLFTSHSQSKKALNFLRTYLTTEPSSTPSDHPESPGP